MSVPTQKTRWHNSTRAHDTVFDGFKTTPHKTVCGGVRTCNAMRPFGLHRHHTRPPAPTHTRGGIRHEEHGQKRLHGLKSRARAHHECAPHTTHGTSATPRWWPQGRIEGATTPNGHPNHCRNRPRRSCACEGWWESAGFFLELPRRAAACGVRAERSTGRRTPSPQMSLLPSKKLLQSHR
jgi:hypothetical protein